MNTIPTLALALTHSGNHGMNIAAASSALQIVLTLASQAVTAPAETRQVDNDSPARRLPAPKADPLGKPSVGKSIRRLAVRPPERWGINE